MPAELEEVFGEGVLDRTLVLLTCGDYLMGRTEQVCQLYLCVLWYYKASKTCFFDRPAILKPLGTSL